MVQSEHYKAAGSSRKANSIARSDARTPYQSSSLELDMNDLKSDIDVSSGSRNLVLREYALACDSDLGLAEM